MEGKKDRNNKKKYSIGKIIFTIAFIYIVVSRICALFL